MTSSPAAEASGVDKPAKAAKPPARKRAPAAPMKSPRTRKAASSPTLGAVVEPIPAPLPAVAISVPRRRRRPRAAFGLALSIAAAAAAVLILDRNTDGPGQTSAAAIAISGQELVALAGSPTTPTYWAGPIQGRALELTRTETGTFVRYLPAGTTVGGSTRALTIGTYPLQDAYGTAAGRAKGAGMTSQPTRNGGLAVWNKARPTSVYVAFRGVPSLIEVYAPDAKEARTVALSGRLRTVR